MSCLIEADRINHSEPSRSLALTRIKPGKTSRFAGVYLIRGRGRWRASIRDHHHGIRDTVSLGAYRTEEEAAIAYDLALMVLGYAPVNFPREFYRGVTPPADLLVKLGRLPKP